MEFVVDTSAILAVVGNAPEKPALVGVTKEAVLIAPESVHWEIGNALSAMLRRRRISVEQARQALDEYFRIPVQFVEVDLAEALEVAAAQRIYAYDAYLIVCARTYRLTLLTLDRRLGEAARREKIQVWEMAS